MSPTVTCDRCGRDGRPGEHKGDATLECPDCDRILVRGRLG